MKVPSVRPSVCPFVPSFGRRPHAAAASLLLRARRPADIDQLLCGLRSAAHASGVTLSADVGG